MCGIAGIVTENAQAYAAPLERMVRALRHRGPDGAGTHYFRDCALGHTRLSIVDVAGGAQPMLSERGDRAITFNGEIYGYQAIRRDCHNYPFQTASDTEVLLALYERHTTKLLPHVPGMFAFAIWDERDRLLFCGRDRFGEKPLYYGWGRNGEFLFASEIKALLAAGLIQPILNKKAVAHYLARLYVHPSHTIYSNVYTLPPAHYLIYRDGNVTVQRYWTLPSPRTAISMDEAVDQFRSLLRQSVQQQLVADVPIGAFLSGGLDSSTIVGLAAQHVARVRTFSFGFDGDMSELPFARAAAALYGTDHTEMRAEHCDISELLHSMQTVYDEPFADSSNIPTYLLCEQARRHVKVALTGDGGDELLGGYRWYKPLLWMGQSRRYLKQLLIRAVAKAAACLRLRQGRRWEERAQGCHYARRYRTVLEAHSRQGYWFQMSDLAAFGLLSDFEQPLPARQWGPSDTVDDALRMDLEDYMPGDILVKIDRAAMAHGLELRAPFLDVEFASFCISLPWRLKVTEDADKVLLRSSFAAEWPAAIRARSKQGFGAPVRQWLARPSVAALKERCLGNPRQALFDLLPFEAVRDVTRQNDYRTWLLLNLGLWMEKHGPSLAANDKASGRECELLI